MINVVKLEYDIRLGIVQSIIVFEKTNTKYIEERYRYVCSEFNNQVWERQRIEICSAEIKLGCKYPARKSNEVEMLDIEKVIKKVCWEHALRHNFDDSAIKIVVTYEDIKPLILYRMNDLSKKLLESLELHRSSTPLILETLIKITDILENMMIYDRRNTDAITSKIMDLKKSIRDLLQ